jgi:CRISPR-associated exonuclease Cas4
MDVNGTLLWYYNICKREVWLMNRAIVPDQHNDNIDLGRFIHEQSYSRKDKEVSFGNVKFDVVFKSKDKLIIGETKKTSKYKEASKWQLLFYLRVLKQAGINAEGVLLCPQEKKRTPILLNKENEESLDEMIEDIKKICSTKYPIKPKKIPFCKNCAYKEYCFA